jgi:thiol-disulfide isomerase/thioredoxin
MKSLVSLGGISLLLASTVLAEEIEVLETYDAAEYFELNVPNDLENFEVNKDFLFDELVPYDVIINESNVVFSEPIVVENVNERELTEQIDVNNEVFVSEHQIKNSKVDTYEKALARAKAEDKVILLAIRATNCVYCDKMEEGTLIDADVVTALNKNFVTLHLNQDLVDLPIGLQSGMTPNFIFVSNNEDVIDMYPGVRSPKEFIDALEEILLKSK